MMHKQFLHSSFPFRGDVKIPTYKPHTNHKWPSVRSHTLAPTTICDLSHSVCRSPLTDPGHISSVTYVCHSLWFVCGHRKGILTSPLICWKELNYLFKFFIYPTWISNLLVFTNNPALIVHATKLRICIFPACLHFLLKRSFTAVYIRLSLQDDNTLMLEMVLGKA